ncbi:helix-turn-helix domain-containing protein [Streptosporangium sp. NPDC003464]
MSVIEFGTQHLPAGERFDFWVDQIFKSHVSSLIQSDAKHDFQASVLSLNLGTVTVSALETPPLRSSRTTRLIRQSDPEAGLIHLPYGQPGYASQRKRECRLTAGDIVLYDSSRPLCVLQDSGDAVSRWILVEIPRKELELAIPSIEELVAVPLCARAGVGRLLSRYLDELLGNARTYDETDLGALGLITIDLIAAMCAQQTGTHAQSLPMSGEALLVSIRRFIEQHLADPGLTPERIAAAHHISVRYLHKLFHMQDGPSVAAWIRGQRLERCRRDLRNSQLEQVPVAIIAQRWGFPDPAHFTRRFRSTYGSTPTEYRQMCLREDRARRS